MEQHQEEMRPGNGILPESAPLANPYVPFQLDDPPKYRHDMAIIRGTVFPGLDLPFKGMVNKLPLPNTPMANLQKLSFYITELAEYLDTHKDDNDVLAIYQEYQKAYHEAAKEYQHKIRPMNHFDPSKGGKYKWLDDPWPWEYAANRGV